MALRFLLVSLVAGLGVDLPDGEAMMTWARSGREWIQSRLDQATGTFSSLAASDPARQDDDAFSDVVDEIASRFGAELATNDRPARDRGPMFEPQDVPIETLTGVAHGLNRDGQGVGVAIDSSPESTDRSTGPTSIRLDRVVTAVTLTRQAASAWLTVLGDRSGAVISR